MNLVEHVVGLMDGGMMGNCGGTQECQSYGAALQSVSAPVTAIFIVIFLKICTTQDLYL